MNSTEVIRAENAMYGPDVIRIAVQRALTQHGLANSPGFMSGAGEPMLCAASCLAYAGVLLQDGPTAATTFSLRACQASGKDYVAKTFEVLGWTRSACANKMEPNDALEPERRLPWFLQELEA